MLCMHIPPTERDIMQRYFLHSIDEQKRNGKTTKKLYIRQWYSLMRLWLYNNSYSLNPNRVNNFTTGPYYCAKLIALALHNLHSDDQAAIFNCMFGNPIMSTCGDSLNNKIKYCLSSICMQKIVVHSSTKMNSLFFFFCWYIKESLYAWRLDSVYQSVITLVVHIMLWLNEFVQLKMKLRKIRDVNAKHIDAATSIEKEMFIEEDIVLRWS